VGRDARRRAVGRLLLTTAVIIITLVVQGFTLAPLVRRAGSR
jgi:NhaP-type Na+/H+ or K+/H+ antiporter